MSKINRVPAGLLDFFEMKTGGVTPPEFSDSIAGVLEMTEFYSHPRYEAVNTSTTGTAVGDTVFETVPNGQFWIVRAVGAGCTLNGNTGNGIAQMGVAIRLTDGGTITLDVGERTLEANSNDTARAIHVFGQPIIIAAGSGVRARIEALDLDGAASFTFNAQAWIARFGPLSDR
jgi:hypothetical protein